MKFDSDKEIDSLLSRHAARTAHSAQRAIESGAHMDADELNAYAEGALPPLARTRYAVHLADCDNCRKAVTTLALAANVKEARELRAETQAEESSVSWRVWLAALFTPAVLRYAVPALALVLVAAIAFIAIKREGGQSNEISQNETPRASAPAAQNEPAKTETQTAPTSTATTGSATTTANGNASQRKAESAPQSAKETETAQANTAPTERVESKNIEELPSVAPKPAAPAPSVALNTPSQRTPSEANETARVAPPKTPAMTVGTTSAGTAPATPAARDKPAESDEIKQQAKAKDEASRDRVGENRREDNSAAAGGALSSSGARKASRRARQESDPRNAQDVKKQERGAMEAEKSDAETRKVGGHNFRRVGDAWVDAAYNSQMPTIQITRGSEQYRALIADEPDIRRVASQLGGEFIIVLKGKAYRIK